ncbi:MAG: hypothetical protein GY850_17665 [bacterium]|nr:hypothetical protein [bacterium]
MQDSGSESPSCFCTDPDALQFETHRNQKKITAGRFPRNDEQSVLLSQPLAESLKVRVGDTLTLKPRFSTAGIRLLVSGIYRTGIDQLDRGIAFCPSGVLPAKNPNWTAAVQ